MARSDPDYEPINHRPDSEIYSQQIVTVITCFCGPYDRADFKLIDPKSGGPISSPRS